MGEDGSSKFLYDIKPFHLLLPHILGRGDKITKGLFKVDKAGKITIPLPGFVVTRALLQDNNASIYIGILKPALNLRFNDGDNLVVLLRRIPVNPCRNQHLARSWKQ